ncbi:hypothetical protein CHS0354_030048 [Potamilus streckersoni]|uniref:Threonyl/alanyl tRNA synthetase SAD domain-containing protein n=1 Tax=Potamilus streckersoni TaxID=2493646 RepID=A0AAE0VES8_9BIVA|nr:hypothetical protein CHS0354_030048 [Potamilus streckersoni]
MLKWMPRKKKHAVRRKVCAPTARYSRYIKHSKKRFQGLHFLGIRLLKRIQMPYHLLKTVLKTNTLKGADEFEIILRNTPFYAESGGQTGDTGIIENDRLQLRVTDTFKPFPGFHICRVKPVSLQDGVLNLSDCKGTAQRCFGVFLVKNTVSLSGLSARGPSVELCGGCHVSATGEISFIKIVSEESVAAGVRRIEAYAGESVADYILKRLECLSESARLAGVKPEGLPDKINKLEDELKQVQRQNRELKTRMFKDHIMSGRFSERVGAIELTQYQPAGHVGVLYKSEADKINLVLTVTDDLHSRLKADGKGGGKDISARCGGNLPAKLPDLITALKQYVIQ